MDKEVQAKIELSLDKSDIDWRCKEYNVELGLLDNECASINLREWGNGKDILLLIHGWGESGGTWRFVGPILAQNMRVISVDLLGFGKSSCPNSLLTASSGFLERQAEMLSALLTKLDLDMGSIHLVGHSMGGTIALEMIRHGGAMPKSLNLIAPLEYGLDSVPSSARPFVFFPSWLLKAISNLGFSEHAMVSQMKGIINDDSNLTREYIDELVLFLSRPTSIKLLERGVSASILGTRSKEEQLSWVARKREIYGKLQCPTQLIWGGGDKLLPKTMAEPILKSVKNVFYLEFPEANHIVQIDNPLPLSLSLIEFIRKSKQSPR